MELIAVIIIGYFVVWASVEWGSESITKAQWDRYETQMNRWKGFED